MIILFLENLVQKLNIRIIYNWDKLNYSYVTASEKRMWMAPRKWAHSFWGFTRFRSLSGEQRYLILTILANKIQVLAGWEAHQNNALFLLSLTAVSLIQQSYVNVAWNSVVHAADVELTTSMWHFRFANLICDKTR